jgi:hypothetical protein
VAATASEAAVVEIAFVGAITRALAGAVEGGVEAALAGAVEAAEWHVY